MSLDECQRTLTLLVLSIIPLAPLTLWLATRDLAPALVVLSIVIIAMAVSASLSPVAVELAGRELRVLRRGTGPLRVRAEDVVAVEDGPDCCDLRLFGTSGFLGRFGLFWTLGFGGHWLYATRSGPAVALRRRRGLPLVLVVDDADRFRRAVNDWLAT